MFLSRKTQYQAIFAEDATASEGTIDLLMVNGARSRVRPIGLAYTEIKDGQPGKSVFVSELQSSAPAQVSDTEVVYPGALNEADLRFRLSLAGAEQDVVIRRRLARPRDLQLDEKLVRVECWSEVLEGPAPEKSAGSVTRADGSVDPDESLNFGPMQINRGEAFSVGDATGSLRISKLWQQISGTNYLIESVPYFELAPLLAQLPAAQARTIDRDKLNALWARASVQVGRAYPRAGQAPPRERQLGNVGVADQNMPSDRKRALPLSLPEIRSAQVQAPKATSVARAEPVRDSSAPGVVLDWTLLGSATNFTFKGDSTYYCNGTVNLSVTGTNATVIEGGTVVKFTNSTASARITIIGPISCQTSAYRPAVFTSKDDSSIGEAITGSTGSPTNFYGQGLQFGGSNTLHDVRFAWLSQAVY